MKIKHENKSRMGMMTAVCAIACSLGGCTADEGRDRTLDGTDEERGVLAGLAILASASDMIQGGKEALTASDSVALFTDGVSFLQEIFGGQEESFATLSQESLDQIQQIVEDTEVGFGFEQYVNGLESLTGDIRTYIRPDCNPRGVSACATEYATISNVTLFDLAKDANRLWDSFNSDGSLHVKQRMLHVPHMVLIASIRTGLLAERAAIDAVRQVSAIESRKVVCGEAESYAAQLSELKSDYADYIDGEFGEVYVDQRSPDNCYGGPGPCTSTRYHHACFDGPDGQVCSEIVKKTISNSCEENCGNENVNDAERLRAEAVGALYEERIDAVLGGAEFDGIIASLEDIADDRRCDDDCMPQEALEAGPLWNNDEAQETCPDVCGSEGGTFTGQWWTTVEGQMSVCQCNFDFC